jgi:hypothetical protein
LHRRDAGLEIQLLQAKGFEERDVIQKEVIPNNMYTNQPGALFFLGNKRSGTSHLVRLLNLHSQVFVTHESDIIWILYQIRSGKDLECYPWDGPLGMEATMEAGKDVFEIYGKNIVEGHDIPEVFFQIEHRLMRNGSKIQKPYDKADLVWIGDKKPVQQSDPQVRQFIHIYFPQARFIHIIRHPKAVVASMVEAGKEWAQVAYWKSSPAEILRRWAIHEEWVLEARSEGHKVCTLRFEDLCEKPFETMKEVFTFLDLEMSPEIAEMVVKNTSPNPNRKYASYILPPCPEADKVMSIYGYER